MPTDSGTQSWLKRVPSGGTPYFCAKIAINTGASCQSGLAGSVPSGDSASSHSCGARPA